VHSASYGEYERGRGAGGFGLLNRVLIFVIIVGLGIGGVIVSMPIYRQSREQIARLRQLDSELAREKALHARRVREKQLLENDPAYLEIISRDKLDVMKPGETIIRLDPPRGANP